LKTKALSTFSCLIVALLLVSFSDPYTIKRISDANFRYEFYTTDKEVKPKADKIYYWFKGGLIHNAQAGTAGMLLNGPFVKMYHSNQLAEQGTFKNGLKTGLWKTWYPNGIVETTQKWGNGVKSGMFYHFDENGIMTEKGKYSSGRKQGKWVDLVKNDTISYKNGILSVKKPKLSKEEKAKLKEESKKADIAKKTASEEAKAKLKEEKEKADIAKKTAKEEAKAKKAAAKEPKRTSEKNPGKDGFFKKIFGKKQPTQNANG
jgi:hypothetical protein